VELLEQREVLESKSFISSIADSDAVKLMQANGGGASELNLFYGDLALDSYDWDPANETFVGV
jgi:hypothetical protein